MNTVLYYLNQFSEFLAINYISFMIIPLCIVTSVCGGITTFYFKKKIKVHTKNQQSKVKYFFNFIWCFIIIFELLIFFITLNVGCYLFNKHKTARFINFYDEFPSYNNYNSNNEEYIHSIFWAPIADSNFVFTLSHLSYFFILMLQVIIFFTFFAFITNNMERRSFFFTSEKKIINLESIIKNFFIFVFSILSLQLILIIFFTTEHIFIFFISFESSVLPIFFIIGFFGKRSSKFKAMDYLLYFTLISAIPFFFFLLYVYHYTGIVYFPELKLAFVSNTFSYFECIVMFIALFIPFSVKFAFFPFHVWLPEAHVEASTEGSMLLSGIMLKIGFFGIFKYCFGLCMQVIFSVAPVIVCCALIGSLSTALSTYRQLDIKKIIAYSSVVHMNIAVIGFFVLSATAIEATLFMNFSHAIISAGLFYAVGILQDRIKTRSIIEIAGLWTIMPKWSSCFGILLLANAGMPGTVGFIPEICLIWGIFTHFPIVGFLMMLPIAIIAIRNFLLFTQICFGVNYSYFNEGLITVFKSNVSSIVEQKDSIHRNNSDKVVIYSIILTKYWDINNQRDGIVLYIINCFIIFFGINPSFITFFLSSAAFMFDSHFYFLKN